MSSSAESYCWIILTAIVVLFGKILFDHRQLLIERFQSSKKKCGTIDRSRRGLLLVILLPVSVLYEFVESNALPRYGSAPQHDGARALYPVRPSVLFFFNCPESDYCPRASPHGGRLFVLDGQCQLPLRGGYSAPGVSAGDDVRRTRHPFQHQQQQKQFRR